MVATETVLLGVVLVLLVALVVLVWRLAARVDRERAVSTDQLSAALGETWQEMELGEKVGQIENHAAAMNEAHQDITEMLRNPQARGEFGEQQLDVLLGDHLPPDMYGIRKQVVEGKTPDAHIETSEGVVCIDSKFPLDNYEAALGAEDEATTAQYERKFRNDVDRQLEKIATDYVRPEAGTTPFAFAFIPSESVYYHLVSEEYDLLREYTTRGVQVVSPLTLGHKLELIKADVHARRLSEQAEEIQAQLQRLGTAFETFDDEWSTLQTHIRNAESKADDVDRSVQSLQSEFARIDEPDLEDAE
ncbi:MAG: DNA recombination protein RmuC [Halobacteriaceae archaeon]